MCFCCTNGIENDGDGAAVAFFFIVRLGGCKAGLIDDKGGLSGGGPEVLADGVAACGDARDGHARILEDAGGFGVVGDDGNLHNEVRR